MQNDDEVGPRAPRQSSWRWRGFWLGVGAVLALSVFALEEAVFSTPPLTFTVGTSGESGVLGDWESAPDDAPLPIVFSDGTRVDLGPNATARVVAVGRAGAEIVIESGEADIDIVPARLRVPGETPWRVRLGPYVVEALDTRFDVGWDPRADDFSANVTQGQLDVSGCEHDPSRRLFAGQGVHASCSDKQWSPVSLAAP
jgi:ferric-dicitrate binding protein FerR (iron transport regulator)